MIKRESSGMWSCPSCTYENQPYSDKCEVCSAANPFASSKKVPKAALVESEPTLICEACTFVNSIQNIKCEVCGAVIADQQEEPQVSPKHGEKLTDCKHCGFQNDNTNQTCVSCDSNLNDLEQHEQEYYDEEDVVMRTCSICGCEVSSFALKRHQRQCMESLKIIEDIKEQFPEEYGSKQCLYCNQKCEIDLKDHYKVCTQKREFFDDKKSFDRMSPVQLNAIKFMYENSEKQHYSAKPRIIKRIQSLGFKVKDIEALHHYIENYAPIIVHIHVSRYMNLFVKDTHYRNQFQTNTSSGSLSNTSRTSWENRMFNHKYAKATGFERVKYGTVNLTNDPTGVQCCLGYGNSYLLLKEHVRKRCTFTDMDSSSASSKIGVFKFGFHVLERLSDPEVKAIIEGAKAIEVSSQVVSTYKEIQIHGPLDFSKDVERLYVNEIELQDPKILEEVKAFSEKFKVDYEVFKPKEPGAMFPASFGGVSLPPWRSKAPRPVKSKRR